LTEMSMPARPATHPGLVYLELEFQRSFSLALRGVHRDAAHVIPPLAARLRNAPVAIGV
jgi:putative flavoprotein involved in K+ transport